MAKAFPPAYTLDELAFLEREAAAGKSFVEISAEWPNKVHGRSATALKDRLIKVVAKKVADGADADRLVANFKNSITTVEVDKILERDAKKAATKAAKATHKQDLKDINAKLDAIMAHFNISLTKKSAKPAADTETETEAPAPAPKPKAKPAAKPAESDAEKPTPKPKAAAAKAPAAAKTAESDADKPTPGLGSNAASGKPKTTKTATKKE